MILYAHRIYSPFTDLNTEEINSESHELYGKIRHNALPIFVERNRNTPHVIVLTQPHLTFFFTLIFPCHLSFQPDIHWYYTVLQPRCDIFVYIAWQNRLNLHHYSAHHLSVKQWLKKPRTWNWSYVKNIIFTIYSWIQSLSKLFIFYSLINTKYSLTESALMSFNIWPPIEMN